MHCKQCGTEVIEIWGNTTLHMDGIEVTVVEAPIGFCCVCNIENLPDEIEEMIAGLVQLKKKQYPKSPPNLYVHAREVLYGICV